MNAETMPSNDPAAAPRPDAEPPPVETKAQRIERERLERAAQTKADAEILLDYEPSERRAHAVSLGWHDSRIRRALELARLRTPKPEPKPESDEEHESRKTAVPEPGEHEVRISTKLADNIDTAASALCLDAEIYHRNAELVRVVRTTAEAADASATIVDGEKRYRIIEGTPQVHRVETPTLRERLTRVASFTKWDGRLNKGEGAWRPSLPPDAIVQGLAARKQWPGLRELAGVIEAPSMRPDGTLIDVPGHDRATGFLYSPALHFPAIPAKPTQADACRSLLELAEVFCDFPFDSEASRYVPIAALLTIMVRPAILGAVPAFLFDSPTPGTGKSRVTDALCIIATGRGAPRGTFPPAVDELEKILAAYALRGATVVGFDNVDAGFGGAPLDKAITAIDTVDFRILGQSTCPSLRWIAVILASGNNLVVLSDTFRRVLISRIESTLENPADRPDAEFKHSPLLPWVAENRARLVCAALTVLRAFIVAGRPSQGLKSFGSFEAWTDLVANAIVFAGGANVLEAQTKVGAGDSGERGTIVTLLQHWSRLDKAGDGLAARDAIRALYPDRNPHEPPAEPDGFDEMRDAVEALAGSLPGRRPSSHALGNAMRKIRHRVYGMPDGVKKRLVTDPDKHAKSMRWRVEIVGGAS